MNSKIEIGFAFKPRGKRYEDVTSIADKYVIIVSRQDGHGMTAEEAYTVVKGFMDCRCWDKQKINKTRKAKFSG